MKIFLIQCDNEGIPINDMAMAIIEGVRFHHWIRHYITDWEYDYVLIKDNSFINDKTGESYVQSKSCIPVGNIEFVEKFLSEAGLKLPKPLNIPKELRESEFLGREIEYIRVPNLEKGLALNGEKFVKSEDRIKGANGLTDEINIGFVMGERQKFNCPEDSYSKRFLVSEKIDIESEWRCFVHNKKLIDVCRYSGDFDKIPNRNIIEKMIDTYQNCSPAYTLDVAVLTTGETVVIEVHNFWSCGLYGFPADERILRMAAAAFAWELKQSR